MASTSWVVEVGAEPLEAPVEVGRGCSAEAGEVEIGSPTISGVPRGWIGSSSSESSSTKILSRSLSTCVPAASGLVPGAPLHIQRRHLPEQMIGDLHERVTRTRFISPDSHAHSAFVVSFEPRDVTHALSDSSWVNAMHEELQIFERNKVWTLVELPPNKHVIGTKWIFKNKQCEEAVLVQMWPLPHELQR